MKNIVTVLLFFFLFQSVSAQKKTIMVSDFENKPNTSGWWRDNQNVRFSYDEIPEHQAGKNSKVCLYIKWDSTQIAKPFTWFTDLKADTFAAPGMENEWKEFRDKTWMSFWCRLGDGDTVMLHWLVLSKGHSSKWGAKNMIPLTSGKWIFVKVKFSELEYDNWGKITAPFNLNSDEIRCFEAGLRLATQNSKGFVEAWFDNIKLTNYEPFE